MYRNVEKMPSITVPGGLSPEEQAAYIRAEMVKIGLDPSKQHDAFVLRDYWCYDDGKRVPMRLDGTIKEE